MRQVFVQTCGMVGFSIVYLSSPKPGHTTGRSGTHGAEWTAGQGNAGRNKVTTFRSPLEQTALVAFQHNVKNCPERFFTSTNKEILCKPTAERNDLLTRGLSAVYDRDRERSSLLAVDQ